MTKKRNPPKTDEAGTDVVDYEAQMAAEAKAVAKTERVSADRFTLQSGILSYMGNPIPDNKMNCIIVSALGENIHYAGDWDPDLIVPPTCYGLGAPGEPMFPHPDIEEPINADCKSCPYMKFKSAPNKKGKWCKEKRRLAIIPFAESAEELGSGEMAMMTIPVMSVKNWSVYVNLISAKFNRPSWGMVTEVKVVPDPKSQFRVLFTEVAPLPSDHLGAVHGRLEAAVTMLETPYDMNPEPPEKEEEADGKSKKY